MLKTVRITFQLSDEPKKNIIRTFNKISQKFGHINLVGETFNDLNLLIELVNLTKKYNNKITISGSYQSIHHLIQTEETKMKYIFEHIDILGLIIDEPQFDLKLITNVVSLALQLNTTVNFVTYLTSENENFKDTNKLGELNFHEWYLYTDNLELFNQFKESNPIENIIHKNDYYYVITSGQFVNHTGKVISSINKPSHEIYRDIVKYNPTLKQQINQIGFQYWIDQTYLEKITKKIKSGKAVFFDVEAVSRESTNSQKHNLKDYPIPILYAILKIDSKSLKVIDRNSYSCTDVTNLHTVYHEFLEYVKKNEIEFLVVSNGDLEKRFIDNCIFYLKNKLKLEDFRYLFKLRDQMIDIQKIIDKQMNSYKLLQEISANYPDLVTFNRKTTKLSFKINFLLDGLIFGPKHHKKEIQKIIEYCFEDVYADFELFKFYDFIYNHNLIKSEKMNHK